MSQKLLNRPPKDLLAELIMQANPGFVFNFNAISIQEAAENGNSAYTRNTRAHVIPKPDVIPAEYRESSYIWYDRIGLDEFFIGMVPVLLIDDSVVSTKDLVPLIQATYGIVLEEGSYQDMPIVRGSVYPYPHVVEMKSDALAWRHSATFYLRDPNIDIDEMIDNPVLDGLYFPFFTVGRIQGLLYSYAVDCTAMRSELSALAVGDSLQQVVDLYNNVAPTPWQYIGREAESNLYGAKVLATGTTSELISEGYPVNPSFSYAVVVKLDSLYCTNYGGVLLLQYN